MIDLTDRVAVVTGGASGIGRGICLSLAGQGADIAVADLDQPTAMSVAAEVTGAGRDAMAVAIDVSNKASVSEAIGQVLDRFGRIDILVNNAGVLGAPGWWERDPPDDDDWDLILAVNLRGVVNVTQAVMPHMKERRDGKIVNIASIAGRQGGPDVPAYHASKAGVISWTQSNALQLAEYNINVNAICPGVLWTSMYERLTARRTTFVPEAEITGLKGRDYFDKMVELRVPMKREQTPEDIGKTTAFLVSDDARNITGQAINVDGGIRMN